LSPATAIPVAASTAATIVAAMNFLRRTTDHPSPELPLSPNRFCGVFHTG
jgi:hypothetical protein